MLTNGQKPVRKVVAYSRCSSDESRQDTENQLQELRRYVSARNWTAVEYVDRGVSGSKDRRPALDQLIADAKRRRLDRLGRNLRP